MKGSTISNTIATGFAIFSMHFGAGNVIFPLALGQYAQDKNFYASLGLLITAVGVPFIGLMSMTLFNGNYKHFFERIGKVPGFILALFIMGLIGPFGAMPRTITVSYAAVKTYLPSMSLWLFSAISCITIFILTFRKARLIDLLGYVLTPILLGSLLLIIIKGIFQAEPATPSDLSKITAFMHGFTEGYHTMDLLGAFFFSSVALSVLEQGVDAHDRKDMRLMIFRTLKAGCIGMSMLGLAYFGFSYVTSHIGAEIVVSSREEIMAATAIRVLGPQAGIIACIAVSLACITTALALAVVFSEFLHKDVFIGKIGYIPCLVVTLLGTFFVSTLDFDGIAKFLAPILQICYPALIMLSILNIFHKLYHIQIVKTPVFIVFAISLGFYLHQIF